MDFTIEYTLHIDIDRIIKFYEIDENTPFRDIHEAIDDYTSGLDDCYYYLIDSDIKKKVFDEIIYRLSGQISLFDTAKE